MPTRCIVGGCKRTTQEGVTLFCFPKDKEMREKWANEIRKTRKEWAGPTNNYGCVVCSEHFTKDCFDKSHEIKASFGIKLRQKYKLLPTAIPTVFATGANALKHRKPSVNRRQIPAKPPPNLQEDFGLQECSNLIKKRPPTCEEEFGLQECSKLLKLMAAPKEILCAKCNVATETKGTQTSFSFNTMEIQKSLLNETAISSYRDNEENVVLKTADYVVKEALDVVQNKNNNVKKKGETVELVTKKNCDLTIKKDLSKSNKDLCPNSVPVSTEKLHRLNNIGLTKHNKSSRTMDTVINKIIARSGSTTNYEYSIRTEDNTCLNGSRKTKTI